MNVRTLSVWIALIFLVTTLPSSAWQDEGHHMITELAIELLPEPLKGHLSTHKAYILAHDMDPDYWRAADLHEDPHHFIDLDAYGKYPFESLPRDYGEAVKKHGLPKVERNGTVPWTIEHRFNLLVSAFQRRGDQHLFDAAILAHYVEDAHVPFHAVLNYDGQLTGQRGIHARFEGDLVRKFIKIEELKRLPVAPTMGPVHLAVFEWSLESFTYADDLLESDSEAKTTAGDYNDKYYESFGKVATPIAKQRIEQAAVRLAALWQRAYEEAGRPDLSKIRY